MTRIRWVKSALMGASVAALAAGAAVAQGPATQASTAQPAATASAGPAKAPIRRKKRAVVTAPKDVVESGAVAALGKMSAYLRSNRVFQAKMVTQRDEVDDYGQLLTFNGETTFKVKAPDAFSIETRDADKTRLYVYDGKSVTQFDPKTGYYTRFDAPPTIRQTLNEAAEKYGVTVPLDDLFHWDEGDSQSQKLTSGHFVGVDKVDDQDADHYAFRQPGVDWQIWIAQGDKPAPLRVVIVANDDPARPQFEADLSWDMSPQFTADTFVFTPPPEAKSIPIVARAPSSAQ